MGIGLILHHLPAADFSQIDRFNFYIKLFYHYFLLIQTKLAANNRHLNHLKFKLRVKKNVNAYYKNAIWPTLAS